MATNPYYNRYTNFIPDTSVRSSDMDQELDGIVRGFDLLGDPTLLGNGGSLLGTDTGTSDNYVYTNGESTTVLVDGQIITFMPTNGSTGPTVISYNGGDNIEVVRNDGTPIQAGDIIDGVPIMLIYDEINNRWVVVGATAGQVNENLRPGINNQTGTTYTLLATDEGKLILCDNAANITVTVPSDADAATPTGYIAHIHQMGAGIVTLDPGAGVTLNYPTGRSTRTQYSSLSVIKVAANTWNVIGDAA